MLIQLTLELVIRYISGSELIIISWNVIFLFNITLFFLIRKKNLLLFITIYFFYDVFCGSITSQLLFQYF
jgi:hypothetical protein